MKFKSTNNKSPTASFHNALFKGLAPDGGLYIPLAMPHLSKEFIDNIHQFSIFDMATRILAAFITEMPVNVLEKIVHKTFHFPIPLVNLSSNYYLLELFHGPTLAFKDIGARFMAEALNYYLDDENKKMNILVATSGDTGSAVAQGFHKIPNVDVYILYPSQKITSMQELQMTTLGDNIHAIEVEGTFDDCQRLVKSALNDVELSKIANFTTANSINIARLLPQIIYYFWGVAQLQKLGVSQNPSIVVPSGNFGNLTAAAYAKALGAPVHQLVAATNSNDVVPEYLNSGIYKPRESIKTLSNAMDVGDPSNFVRLLALYDNDYKKIKDAITSITVTDTETLSEMVYSYKQTKKILDPHTAVGVAAARRVIDSNAPLIIAATAHPAKFSDVVKQALQIDIPMPVQLQKLLNKNKKSTVIKPDFSQWKKYLYTQVL